MTDFQAAHLFLKHVFPHHGLPKVIVSDRDSKFWSAFWTTLFDNLDTTLDFTSSFHPESNGQSEVTNRTIIDLLKAYVHSQPKKWDQFLHLLQFAYNNTTHSSTGKAPFEVVYGHTLPTPATRLSNTIPWLILLLLSLLQFMLMYKLLFHMHNKCLHVKLTSTVKLMFSL